MALFKKRNNNIMAWYLSTDGDGGIPCAGYTSLADNPEIFTACRTIAQLISSMTIQLMGNTKDGDVRIKNELSRKIDIYPNKYQTRRTWMEAIVMNLLLYGKGNAVVYPHTKEGLLDDLEVIAPSRLGYYRDGRGYYITIDGVRFEPDNLLHFVDNPDQNYSWKGRGTTVHLRDVANNLKQAAATKKGFMESKWKPSMIISVDALVEEFSSPKGRQKLVEEYVANQEAGTPWVIPSDQFKVETVKPLSLNDIALHDSVKIDKRTVASILGVPPFVLGEGDYSKEAWNSFVQNKVKPIAQEIEEELTRKLILSPDWYLKFNTWSLMDWDIKTIAEVFSSLSDRGIVDGNEVRDKLGMQPRDGLNELRILENYIPFGDSGNQKKLIKGDGDE